MFRLLYSHSPPLPLPLLLIVNIEGVVYVLVIVVVVVGVVFDIKLEHYLVLGHFDVDIPICVRIDSPRSHSTQRMKTTERVSQREITRFLTWELT